MRIVVSGVQFCMDVERRRSAYRLSRSAPSDNDIFVSDLTTWCRGIAEKARIAGFSEEAEQSGLLLYQYAGI